MSHNQNMGSIKYFFMWVELLYFRQSIIQNYSNKKMLLKHTLFLILLFPIHFLIGNNVTADAPKIILENVDFSISFTGDFNLDDSFTLNHNNRKYSPTSVSTSKIKFDNINTKNIW